MGQPDPVRKTALPEITFTPDEKLADGMTWWAVRNERGVICGFKQITTLELIERVEGTNAAFTQSEINAMMRSEAAA